MKTALVTGSIAVVWTPAFTGVVSTIASDPSACSAMRGRGFHGNDSFSGYASYEFALGPGAGSP